MVLRSLAAVAGLTLALGSLTAPGCTVDDEARPTLPAPNATTTPTSTASGQTLVCGPISPSSCYQPDGCCLVKDSKCMAKVDNGAAEHKTLRMSQLRVKSPPKLSNKLVQNTIVTPAVTQLDPACRFKDVNKGGLFNWLIDLDTTTGTLRTGGARAVEDINEGYCFLKAEYSGIVVEPITAELNFDKATGQFATKAPLARLSVPIFQKRDPNDVPILLPLRNAEIYDGTLSENGNCIGHFRGEPGELDSDCNTITSDVADPNSYRFENGGKIKGMITLEEADQVKIVDLKQTLCALLVPTAEIVDGADGYKVCKREGAALSAGVMKVADAASEPGGANDAVGLSAEFAASSIKIKDGECN